MYRRCAISRLRALSRVHRVRAGNRGSMRAGDGVDGTHTDLTRRAWTHKEPCLEVQFIETTSDLAADDHSSCGQPTRRFASPRAHSSPWCQILHHIHATRELRTRNDSLFHLAADRVGWNDHGPCAHLSHPATSAALGSDRRPQTSSILHGLKEVHMYAAGHATNDESM